jgi:hypothetical protein
MADMDSLAPVRVVHRVYGPGILQRLLAPKGHARAQFDIDDGVARRVLLGDLAPERAEDPEVTS